MRGPGLAATTPSDPKLEPHANPLDVAPDGHAEFLKKRHSVHKLLVAQRLDQCSVAVAGAWTLAFADEGDPTFCVLEWIEAGWRDPVLVNTALRICGTRTDAEACMDLLERDVAARYEDAVVGDLAEAMIALKASRKPENAA